VPLPAAKLIAAIPNAAATLGDDAAHAEAFANAILTTDTHAKVAQASFAVEGRNVHLFGCAKGAGMIGPQLAVFAGPQALHATMLVYLFTDLAAEPDQLAAMLTPAVEDSFNAISIDGDMSTNDTVLLLASGASGAVIEPGNAEFAAALTQVCTSLARQIVADGEGITHVVELRVNGAATDADALKVAKAIAHSPLVKTAWAGGDPNWGRLMAAIGYAGAAIDPERIDIRFGELPICRDGGRAAEFDEKAAHDYIAQAECAVSIELNQGAGSCVFWTTDLTHEYISINADYSS